MHIEEAITTFQINFQHNTTFNVASSYQNCAVLDVKCLELPRSKRKLFNDSTIGIASVLEQTIDSTFSSNASKFSLFNVA